MNRRLAHTLLCSLLATGAMSQGGSTPTNSPAEQGNGLEQGLKNYFQAFDYQSVGLTQAPTLKSYSADSQSRTLTVTADEYFSQQIFTQKKLDHILKGIRESVPDEWQSYDIVLWTDGRRVTDLIAEQKHAPAATLQSWGTIAHKGQPWVTNSSRPTTFPRGLEGRHLAVWASHGRYYDNKSGTWKWQRPNLFCTTEDLLTQTFTLPYLIPMLQNAGAVVWTPRERDWQSHEVIVDNDQRGAGYTEVYGSWKTTQAKGFALHAGNYRDGENPFEAGTARMTKTTSKAKKMAAALYLPDIPEEGDYAVYVSYQTLKKSTSAALYTVRHQGIDTQFTVNQQMGGGTWVYLGTFHFDKGRSENGVMVSNLSQDKGIVTTDAVRFGGGMGNIERGGTVSGFPRWAEGARYSAQWYGAPRSVVSINEGKHDYNDDINCRSLMENWLAGGSVYVPNRTGLGVPIELSLAMHSDDGYRKNGSHIGTLTICTTDYKGNALLNSGLTRKVSKDYAQLLLEQACGDLEQTYGITWPNRTVWDKNYNECRRPEVPSAIIEMLAHQNFGDLRLAHDPNFKFTLSRAVYKAMARFAASQHGQSAIIQPLAPQTFSITLGGGKARLSWQPTGDPLEPTATPTSYIVYTREGTADFDNGKLVKQNYTEHALEPGRRTDFRVTAVNAGGESFPSETLSAVCQEGATKTVLVVNGFRRLSSPAVIDTDTRKGFDLDQDPGVSYIRTAGWAGRQTVFDAAQGGKEGPGALGYGGNELAGQVVAGNTFDYVSDHAEAICSAGQYNVVSCSVEAVEQGLVSLADYDCVDLILGLEKNDGHSLRPYKTFSPTLQSLLADYAAHGGRLLVSGSYVGSDMQTDAERAFLANVLKTSWTGTLPSVGSATGMGKTFAFHHTLNEQHYAATHPDGLAPVGAAFTTMAYEDGQSAAVAYNGADYKAVTMGFPWETIRDSDTRQAIMRGLLQFLLAAN